MKTYFLILCLLLLPGTLLATITGTPIESLPSDNSPGNADLFPIYAWNGSQYVASKIPAGNYVLSNDFSNPTNNGVISSNSFSMLGNYSTTAVNYYGQKPIFYDSYQYGVSFSGQDFTNAVINFASIGLPAIAPTCIILDEGWNTNRNANGVQQWNLTNYQDVDFTDYISFAHSRGIKVMLYTENDTVLESGWGPGSSGTNLEFDAQTFASWGIDGAKLDFTGPNDAYIVQQEQRFESAFRAAAHGKICYFDEDIDGNAPASIAPNLPIAIPTNIILYTALPGSEFRVFNENPGTFQNGWLADEAFRLNFDISNALVLGSASTWLIPSEYYNEGAQDAVDWMGCTFLASGSGIQLYNCIVGATNGMNGPNFYPYMWRILTNATAMQIYQDPLNCEPNFDSADSVTNPPIYRHLANGNVVAAIYTCCTNKADAVTLNFTNIGLPMNTTYQLYDVLEQTNFGNFANSFTYTVQPEQVEWGGTLELPTAKLILFSPVSGTTYTPLGYYSYDVPLSSFETASGSPTIQKVPGFNTYGINLLNNLYAGDQYGGYIAGFPIPVINFSQAASANAAYDNLTVNIQVYSTNTGTEFTGNQPFMYLYWQTNWVMQSFNSPSYSGNITASNVLTYSYTFQNIPTNVDAISIYPFGNGWGASPTIVSNLWLLGVNVQN